MFSGRTQVWIQCLLIQLASLWKQDDDNDDDDDDSNDYDSDDGNVFINIE